MSATLPENHSTVQGVKIDRDDVLRAMEHFDTQLRETYPQRKWKRYAVRHNGKNYPPKDLLRLATGLDKVAGGGEPVNKHFETLGFTVDFIDGGNPLIASCAHADDEEDEALISLEVDIENALVANLGQLESGLRLYDEGGKTGQQYQISFDDKKKGRIDILAVDSRGNFVVIEIKAGEADRDVCGQIQGYMGWVKQHMAINQVVRGIVIANRYTVRAAYAARIVPELSLKECKINFSFADA